MKNTNQLEVLEALKSGHNIFLTGSAGTGKTHVIKEFAKLAGQKVIMTATTGIAALSIGGETIHRFLKLGISSRPFEAAKILSGWDNALRRSGELRFLIENLDTLVIDEVSMLRRDQFELIDIILSHIKDSPLPFGGVQMVLVGDFLQLPPVVTNFDLNLYSDLSEPFCFQSDLWGQGDFKSFNLIKNYRQDDEKFLSVLESIRYGKITNEVASMLNARVGVALEDGAEPVKLFSHKSAVKKENMNCLSKLSADKLISDAEYSGTKYHVDSLKKDCPADDELYFCDGAQVMMVTNEANGKWVNGSMGIIDKASTADVYIKLYDGSMVTVSPHKWERKVHTIMDKNMSTKTVASMTQYPFKLAYASTIHKSQGLTLDAIDIDLSRCFTHGQAYVALSRARSITGLTLRGWNKTSVKVDKRVLDFYKVD